MMVGLLEMMETAVTPSLKLSVDAHFCIILQTGYGEFCEVMHIPIYYYQYTYLKLGFCLSV